jgi:hypothetical protein
MNPRSPKGLAKKTKPAKPNMYYEDDTSDMNLIRDSDVGGMDSADPFETDGYGPEDDQGMTELDEGTDPFALPGEGKMPASDSAPGKLGRLRKKGMPRRD